MNSDFDSQYKQLNREKERLGLIYGILAGLAFSVVTWGYDGFLLASASVDLPWLKFAFGALFCMAVGGFAGWLPEKLDSGLVGFISWLAAGASFAWFTSHLPFEILSKVIPLLDPRFQGFNLYPYPENIRLRMILIYVIVLILSGLVGALETYLVDSARTATSPIAGFLRLGACMVLLGVAGTATDGVNQPLRDPILGVHDTLQFAIQSRGQTVEKKLATEKHLGAVASLDPVLHRPYRLILGNYEPVYLDSFTVYADFDGVWAYCSVMIDSPSYCQLSQDNYPPRLACLLSGKDAQSCLVQVTPQGNQWIEKWKAQVGGSPQMAVTAERGAVTLMDIQGPDLQQYRCQFSGSQFSTVFAGCSPPHTALSLLPTPYSVTLTPATQTVTTTQAVTATSQPAQQGISQSAGTLAAPAGDPGGEQALALQKAAMLPAYQADLTSMGNLTRYDLKVSVDPESRVFNGHARIFYTNNEEKALDLLYFHLLPNGGKAYGNGYLKVSLVQQDGRDSVTELMKQESILQVVLHGPLPPGEHTQLDIDFNGLIPKDFGDSGYGIFNTSDGVTTLSGWYPMLAVFDQRGWHLDEPSSIGDSVFADDALFMVDLTVTPDMVVAATGVQVMNQVGNGSGHYVFASGPAREFTLVMSPDLGVVSRVEHGVKISSYYLPGQENGGTEALSAVADAMSIYGVKFGEYPFSELDVVDTPMKYASGVEFPGIILIASRLYPDVQQPTFSFVVSHEVGHQWWYNLVGDDVFYDPWMDEGLTSYMPPLYFEVEGGSYGYRQAMDYFQGRFNSFLQEGKDDLITASLAHFESLGDGGLTYSAVVYAKGALFFQALRAKIGDQAFFGALKSYYNTYRYKIATPEDLLGEFEKASGQSLKDFYQEWLYSTGTGGSN